MSENAKGNGCKGCSLAPLDDQIIQSLASQIHLEKEQQTDKYEYTRRLELCAACPSFMPRYTCLMNGAIVQIFALRKDAICPHPDKKW